VNGGILVSCEHIIVMITILVMQAASSENLLVLVQFCSPGVCFSADASIVCLTPKMIAPCIMFVICGGC